MANDFFKNGDKAYSENLNDGLLVGNAFDWTVSIGLPADTGGVFPNSSTIVKAKMADVSITPNSNLSIGSTIENNSSSSQVYRLTVYPNFNRFGGFKSILLTADSGVTFYIANKGGTSPIASNLDYDDLGNVPELKVLKEYDIVITIPRNKEVSGVEFVFQSSSADVSGSISQSNVTGLSDSLASKVNVSDINDNLTSTATNVPLSANQGKVLKGLVDTKSDNTHNHYTWIRVYTEPNSNPQSAIATNQYCTIYINQAVRLVDFRFYRQNYNFNNTEENEVGSIKRVYKEASATIINIKPVLPTPLASYNVSINGAVDTDGTILSATNSTGKKTINLRGMWHY